MQITIGSKTYDAEPHHIDEATADAFPHEDLSDPRRFRSFGPPFGYFRNTASAMDTRLIEASRRKIYEYNCLTRRGDTFDLDAKGALRIPPVIYYLVEGNYSRPGLDLKKGKALADRFRNDAGLPTKVGMTDPNVAVDLALTKQVGATLAKLPVNRIKRKYIPDVSFTINVEVKFAYYRLKFGDANKHEHVVIGLPRTIRLITNVLKVCRAETVGGIKRVGEKRGKKEITLPMPPNSQQAKDLRTAYDKAVAERAAARKKREAEDRLERLKRRKKELEESHDWHKKEIDEVKEELEND